MFIAIRGDITDQKYGPSAYLKEATITNKNAILRALSVTSKSSGTSWIQIFDCVGGVTAAKNITAGVIASGVLTSASHGFETGQKVTAASISGITNGSYYVRVVSANTFTLHATYEDAWNNALPKYPDSATPAGTVTGATDGTAYEYPLPTNSVLTFSMKRFSQGIYVRGVTAADGSTLISGSDLKISADFHSGPQTRV